MEKLIAIVGPTAVGKSRFALCLAEEFGGEIVNADSRQIYSYMNIGTAKPGREEFARIPHHLFDIIKPDENFSLADYQSRAFKVIREIQSRGKVPFLVGGSGQYVWGVIENWTIPRVAPDTELRKNLEKRAAAEGNASLFAELQRIDPEGARRTGPFNTRRIIRALEVSQTTGVPFSTQRKKGIPPFETFIIGLTDNRKRLYERIDRRVDAMIKSGLVEEVENLVKMGYDFSLPAMSAIGYREIGEFIRGGIDMETAINRIKFGTHRYVRQQYNWFKLKDDRIKWFDAGEDPLPEMQNLIIDFLK
jgi:tRNA dimethylallyltransferase